MECNDKDDILISQIDLETFKKTMKKYIWCDLVSEALKKRTIKGKINEEILMAIIAESNPKDTIHKTLQKVLQRTDEFMENDEGGETK